jgi:hypothetical protein
MDDLNVTNGTEVLIGQDKAHFRKSSKSNFSGNCVEVAAIGTVVLVRDSKNPGTVVRLSPILWAAFMNYVKEWNS